MLSVNILALLLLFTAVQQYQCQDDLWPDLSCHTGFNVHDNFFPEVVEMCRGGNRGLGGDDGVFFEENPEFEHGLCWKLCILYKFGILRMEMDLNDHVSYYVVDDPDESCLLRFQGLFPEGKGIELVGKVISHCTELYNQVFKVEKLPCNSTRANEFYDCAADALKC